MKTLLTTLTTIILTSMSFTQCIDFDDDNIETCAGIPVTFNGVPTQPLTNVQDFVDFNSGILPTGWSVGGGSTFSQPCGSGIDNTPYYWASTAGSGVPFIESNVYDFTNGGIVGFDMVYAVQGGAAPCEGPDLTNEGVSLMYSTDNGATWNEMIYYSPEGIELPANPQTPGSIINGATTYMSWSTLTFSIPPVAQSPNTMLRWEQFYSSGTCCDNWGIDNISVEESIPGVNYLWSTGDTTLPYVI